MPAHGLIYSVDIYPHIKRMSRHFFYRYSEISRFVNLFTVEDFEQEGWRYLYQLRTMPETEELAGKKLFGWYSRLMQKARTRLSIYPEETYAGLEDDERVRFDNKVYAIYNGYDE